MKMDRNNIFEAAGGLLSLEGRVAMVSGGASGIGRAVASRLAGLGASVAILDKDEPGAEETAARIEGQGGVALSVTCDVTSQQSCREATERTIARFRRIDILCNNAGIIIRKDAVALSEQEWDAVLGVTLKGVWLLSHEVLPHMMHNRSGSIINTGSGWSLKGGPKAAAYCAAKAGVLNLTRAMAIDHGKDGIRVNCVCPGDIDTPMLEQECRQLGESPERFRTEAANRPLPRIGTPDDVADAVLFLASDMAKWVTGACLVVDGGGLA